MARKTASKAIDFEKSLKQLETLVNKLEKGDLSLENSLKNFEDGVKLTRECRQALETAEQKIPVLSKEEDNWTEKDLDNDKDNDAATND